MPAPIPQGEAEGMAEMLFKFGFKNVEAANNDGKTALGIATDYNN